MARKTTVMPMAAGGGIGTRVIATLIALTLLTMLLRDPVGSAHTVRHLAGWVADVVDSLSQFGSALRGGNE